MRGGKRGSARVPFCLCLSLCCALLQEPTATFIAPSRPPLWTGHRVSRRATLACSQNDNKCHAHKREGPAMKRRDFLSSCSAATAMGCSVVGTSLSLSEAAASGVSTPQSPIAGDPAVPYSSTRQYKTIVLANGLRVLLVQDLRISQAATALSVAGAGQWADPNDLPGLAHLCEHMVLSCAPVGSKRFEEWLADDAEGSSNGFTAYDSVCFHFSCPDAYFQEGLERFSGLFTPTLFASVFRNGDTLQREIQRVNSELVPDNPLLQASSLIKSFVNADHPYSRFSMGSAETLERAPRAAGIDVSERLLQFFRTHYTPTEAVLVVTSPQDLMTLQRWVMPFASTLSPTHMHASSPARRFYPGGLVQGTQSKQLILFRNALSGPVWDEESERLFMEWVLNLDYTEDARHDQPVVTAAQIAFLLSQILGRRGHGSLYSFLSQRGWVNSSNSALPRVTLPVEASGFQVIKLEISLTREGFVHRAAVVAAVYDTLKAVCPEPSLTVAPELIQQWASLAKLHGYLLSIRPPDAIELAQDAHLYGLNGRSGVGSGGWYRFPDPDDAAGMAALRRALESTLELMTKHGNGVVITTASQESIDRASLPGPDTSQRWQFEPNAGGRFLLDDMPGLAPQAGQRAPRERPELLPPSVNSLVPVRLTAPRPPFTTLNSRRASAKIVHRAMILLPIARESLVPGMDAGLPLRASSQQDRNAWTLLEPAGYAPVDLALLPSPSFYRVVFGVQLLSTRPASASVRQAALGELWEVSLEAAVADLAELGSPGGLAFDVSFNKYGMRLAFLGISQNLPAYARLFCRRLVQHHSKLLEGPEYFSASVTAAAVTEAQRALGMSQPARIQLASFLRQAKAADAAAEGRAFLRSCSGAVCFAQGDWEESGDVLALQADLEALFAPYISTGERTLSALPAVQDLVYKPVWKPRGVTTPCSLAGIQLISDACGRIPR